MIFNSFTVAKDYTVLARNNRFYRSFQVKKTKLYLLKLPNRTSSTSSYTSGTACLISCEISLFVTAANREGILLATYASLASLARRRR